MTTSPATPHCCVAVVVVDQMAVLRAALGAGEADGVVETVTEAVRRTCTGAAISPTDDGLSLEFTVVDGENADAVLAALRDAVRQPIDIRGRHMRVTASIGYDIVDGQPDEATLLRAAATAEQTSRSGGNRCVRVETDTASDPEAMVRLWGELRAAVQFRQLEVWFQPIVSLATGLPVGVEALSRWHHPRLGDISPSTFIATAEANSEILSIGAFVQERAIQALRAVRTDSSLRLRDLQVSINVGIDELSAPTFAAALLSRAAADEVRPAWLAIEIPAHVVEVSGTTVSDNLRTLSAAGVILSVDDAAGAVSHLPELLDLGVRRVKLERHLVAAVTADGTAATVVRSLLGLARDLHLETVATAVETADQADLLKEFGCESAQGFLYAPAVPGTELASVLHDLSVRRA